MEQLDVFDCLNVLIASYFTGGVPTKTGSIRLFIYAPANWK
jgi:hypothetical protein